MPRCKNPDKLKDNYKKRLIKDCDNLAREICFATWGHKCIKFGCSPSNTALQWCHVFSRSLWHVRWDVYNSFPMHHGCHNFWAHKYPDEFYKTVIKLIGGQQFDALLLRKNTGNFKRSVENLELMKTVLRKRLDKLPRAH